MPQVLTLTRKPEESVEEFAARIAGKMPEFFGGSTEPGTPAEQPDMAPAEEPGVENVSSPTDETADEEPAPSS